MVVNKDRQKGDQGAVSRAKTMIKLRDVNDNEGNPFAPPGGLGASAYPTRFSFKIKALRPVPLRSSTEASSASCALGHI